MKKRILAALLLVSLLAGLTACSSAPQEPEKPDPKNPTDPVEPANPTNPTEPDKPSQPEAPADQTPSGAEGEPKMDYYAALYPVDGNIPAAKDLTACANGLAENVKGRISEITYIFKEGRPAMLLQHGNRDDYREAKTAPAESPMQRIYDEDGLYNYLLYLPDGYDAADTETKWPVIFFFHGIGERGSDLEQLLSYGLPWYLERGGKVPAIVIAPQCPASSHWADTDDEEVKLKEFIPQMAELYNVDTDRMYVTGLSMGGRCAWKIALAMPDTFAAMLVCCGRTNTYDFSQILDMPIWMFHGAEDDTVDFRNVNSIMTKLYEQEHRYYRLTVYPRMGHSIWNTVYDLPEVYDWLLSQSKTRNQAESEG